jgi:hypothetical protein
MLTAWMFHAMRIGSVLAGLGNHNSRYLYAMCCIQLGKLHDAREVLTKGGDREVRPHGHACCSETIKERA